MTNDELKDYAITGVLLCLVVLAGVWFGKIYIDEKPRRRRRR